MNSFGVNSQQFTTKFLKSVIAEFSNTSEKLKLDNLSWAENKIIDISKILQTSNLTKNDAVRA